MSKRDKMIIFDFDGVFADTKNLYRELHKTIGPKYGLDVSQTTFNDLLKKDLLVSLQDQGLAQDEIKNFIEEVDVAARLRINEIKLFTFAESFLSQLSIPLTIVSHNQSAMVRDILQQHNISAKMILGSDNHPNKAEKIKQVLQMYPCKDAYFVGDTPSDISAASDAGVISIAVTWGYYSKDVLQECNPDLLYDEPDQLLHLVNTM